MIAPKQDGAPDLRGLADAFFRPGGRLEGACRGAKFPYEVRPQQQEMAAAVADALAASHHLAVEAGTGVGKSFAYLVPLILHSVEKDIHTVVSTCTISLQEQLIAKDIPFLQQHMGVDFKAVLVKGRNNYLCLRRLARARRMQGELFKTEEQQELERIRAWADTTAEGSVQDLEQQPRHDVWSHVCAEQGNCMGAKCPEYRRCFFMKARARIRDANLLVVNHHLLFSELALRAGGAAFLPDYRVVVLDEGHTIEGVASEHMGIRLSHYAMEHWMRRLLTPDTGKGLLAMLREGEAAQAVTQMWDQVEDFYTTVRKWANLTETETQRVVESPLAIETPLPDTLMRLETLLRGVMERTSDGDVKAELTAVWGHGCELRNNIEAFLKQTLEDQVYWVEREGRRRQQTVLYSAPIEVAPILEKSLFGAMDAVVMTSATLAVGDSLDYFKSRVGASSCVGLQLGSPFQYERQMRLYIAKGLPDPNHAALFAPAAADAVVQFVARTKGRAFVLFTSARMMRQVAELAGERLAAQGLTLFVQGMGLPRHVMLKRFKEAKHGVLFGLDSFWMGVDVPGEALSNVIIVRLPFAVPDQPLTKARMARIREKGGDPFRDYSLPEAILKFRQGVGRLIRTATDEGIVVILDSRVLGKWYGKLFLRSLPECPVEVVDAQG